MLSHDSAPRPPPSPISLQQVASLILSQSSCVSPVGLTDRGGGEMGDGRGAESYDRKKSWPSKAFNTLCFAVISPVLRIRDVYPGSEFFQSRIPADESRVKNIPGSRVKNIPGSRIRIKELKYFNPKKMFPSSWKYDPKCSSRIRILIFYPSRILHLSLLFTTSCTT